MKVLITNPAKKALQNICNHYHSEGYSTYADKLRIEFLNKANSLIHHYHRGQIEEMLLSINQEHRYILMLKHYKLIYLVEPNRIIITDVFDTRQNPDKLILRQ